MAERRFSRMDVVGTLVVLGVALACARLGVWQLDRLEQRRALNALIEARAQQPPLTDAAALTDTATALFRTARFDGRYDAARSIVLPGRALRGAPGVHLLTPFLLAPDTVILVNRGWVPAPDAATIEPDSFPVHAGRIAGLVLPFPTGARGTRDAAPSDSFRITWYEPDLAALRAQFPYTLLPAVLQLLPEPGVSGYPRRLEPPALDEGPHLGYAIQWFSFATIAIVGWIALWRRNRRGRASTVAPPEPQPWP